RSGFLAWAGLSFAKHRVDGRRGEMADRVRSARRGLLRLSHLTNFAPLGLASAEQLGGGHGLVEPGDRAEHLRVAGNFPSLRRRRAVYQLARLPHLGCFIWVVTT